MGEVIVSIGYSDTEILMEQDGIFDFIEENKREFQAKQLEKQMKKPESGVCYLSDHPSHKIVCIGSWLKREAQSNIRGVCRWSASSS